MARGRRFELDAGAGVDTWIVGAGTGVTTGGITGGGIVPTLQVDVPSGLREHVPPVCPSRDGLENGLDAKNFCCQSMGASNKRTQVSQRQGEV